MKLPFSMYFILFGKYTLPIALLALYSPALIAHSFIVTSTSPYSKIIVSNFVQYANANIPIFLTVFGITTLSNS